MDAVNERYWHGGPSASLSAAGVLVHMGDNLEDPDEPWAPCRTGWCAGQTDHMSCSLINARMPNLYTHAHGLILASSTRFECAFTGDGGTQGQPMGRCNNGSWQRCTRDKWWECMWRMDDLETAVATMMDHADSYNEVVVSSAYWASQLPGIIEAVVCRDDCEHARDVHQRFLQRYGQTATQTPLLRIEAGGGFTDIS